ncbi:MAG: heteromeric transposase endonuclease subunit TnsA [Methylococcales bacterium]|jgi:hypothetical protein|nr:heteromeric transposase endonuclease subunit TnsA [Methylococcales bacterium]MBT7442465.1 heteromeric transposase endonuclease subunit TnsA [Methylococcales bacterium]
MGMKKQQNPELKIAKWIKDGRGSGYGKNYLPWITVRDLSSKGRSHRLFGHKSQRIHHLLSDLELAAFLLMEWQTDVSEIREQFPLDRSITKEIALDFGSKHPSFQGVDIVMSSDLYVLMQKNKLSKELAIQVKYSKDLANVRTIEKIDIEREYWARRSIPWQLFTEHNVPAVTFQNIKWLYPRQSKRTIDLDTIEKVDFYWYHIVKSPDKNILEISKAIDKAYELGLGQSLGEIRELLANRYFKFDIKVPCKQLTSHDLELGEIELIQEMINVSA